MGRRQASLGTPVPRTLTVAPGPKVGSGLASRRSQGSSSEHRRPQKPATSVDAWRLIGPGRLRFPTLPRQLHDLTSPWEMQGKPSLPAIVGDVGWPSLTINGEWGGAPAAHHLVLPSHRLGRTRAAGTPEEAARTKASTPPASPLHRGDGSTTSSVEESPDHRGEPFLSVQ